MMAYSYLLIVIGLLLLKEGVGAFNPMEYTPSSANCPAVDRALGESVNINIGMQHFCAKEILTLLVEYFDINPGASSSILMVHGWPSLWSSWGRQIDAFEVSRT